MRVIEIGRANNLKRLRPRNFSDTDLTHSYFELCRFEGDFSTFNWGDADFIDCDLTAVTALPSQRGLSYIYSRGSDWDCGVIPDDIPTRTHDLLRAWYIQRQTGGGDRRTITDFMANYLTDYSHCFSDSIHALTQVLGRTKEVVGIELNTRLFHNSPLFIPTIEQQVRDGVDAEPVRPQDMTDVRVMSAPRRQRAIDISGDLIVTRDRWVLARHLESVWPDHRFYVIQIEPFPIILPMHRRDDIEPDYWWWTAAILA